MNPLLLVVASLAVGIDYGYQPLESGGLEYIIQFEPQQLDSLNEGMDLVSEVPRELDIRRYRIQVGTDKLPRDLGMQPHKRGAAVGRGDDQKGVAREHAESNADDVAAEPAEDRFDPGRKSPANVAANARPDADEEEGTALGGEPVGPDKTFSAQERKNPFAADSFLDRGSPRKLNPADDAGPLPNKGVAAAGFADDADSPGERDRETTNSRQTNKPQLPKDGKSHSKAFADSEAAADTSEPGKPWMTLVWTIAALCVSLGLNVYLGWIALTARERYRLVLERTHGEPVEV